MSLVQRMLVVLTLLKGSKNPHLLILNKKFFFVVNCLQRHGFQTVSVAPSIKTDIVKTCYSLNLTIKSFILQAPGNADGRDKLATNYLLFKLAHVEIKSRLDS